MTADLQALDHEDTSFSALIHASGTCFDQLEPHKSSIISPANTSNTGDMKKEEMAAATGEYQSSDHSEDLDGWDDCGIEVTQAGETGFDMRSSTDSKASKNTKTFGSHTEDWDTDASSLDEFEDAFEHVSHTDVPPNTIEDLQQIHAAHVAGTHHHILPPYRIKGDTADLLTTTYHPDSPGGQALREKYQAQYEKFRPEYEAETDPQYDHWEYDQAVADLKDYRHGLKVVHVRGFTGEIPTIFYDVVCDETCPQYQDSLAKQISRAAQTFKQDWWDDLDVGGLF
ncbi:hypothetical protein CBER1_03916 [Cercospora berteroae]|uniref:Uncharacterized protein n=1 Tax=Cercospora berteroae TaxID=357750 RepID=A0A2S6CA16_9PEZI|nr:hypothetical protein CBER1_03916 [Cercospora berteroae]